MLCKLASVAFALVFAAFLGAAWQCAAAAPSNTGHSSAICVAPATAGQHSTAIHPNAGCRVAQNCASDGSPCSDPNNSNPQYPVCSRDCCSGAYHDCDGLACICGNRP